MILIILVFMINGYIHQFLHETPSLDNQCDDDNSIGLNYFIGEKYFYNYITQNGAFVDFSKITFILWIKFIDNNPYKSTGRQILYQLVDGSDDNPYVNLQLSVFPLNGQLQLALYNGYVKVSYKPQYVLSLSNVANANKLLGWNQVLVSIDQNMQTSYLNMKFYDSYENTYYQLQAPVINGTIFQFIISQQTRITNEALIGQRMIDTRACAFIANFQYYLGWATMDTEKILDYSSKLEFYLQTNGVQLDSLVNQITLKTESGTYIDQESLQIYKNTRLEYIFKQQMDSFLLSFWINPNIVTQGPINPNYQLFSLTDDSLLNTAIGFGVNNQLQLLLYQNFDVQILTQLSSGWTHIIAYFIQNSWNDNFIPQNHKLMNIFVNGIYRMNLGIDNIFQWSRIVIGFSFRDIQDANYVQIRELQIYSGMGLQTSKYGCLFSSNGICILCDPNNPSFTYIANLCPTQIQPTYQNCQMGTAACNITVTSDIETQNSLLCQNNYIYSSLKCIGGISNPCGLSMNKGCYNCLTGTLKLLNTGELRCTAECTSIKNGLYVFNVEGTCQQVCQYYTLYYYNCLLNIPVVTCVDQCPDGYVEVSNGICIHPDFFAIIPSKLRKFDPIKGLITTYTFVPSASLQNYATLKNALLLFPTKVFDQTKTLVQAFKGCQKIFNFPIINNATQLCIYPCGLCYYSSKSTCLTCQDPNQFLDRQFSTCVVSCDKTTGVLKLNNRMTMTCEQSCPGSIQQNLECVSVCSLNYFVFNGKCVKTITVGYYLDSYNAQGCPQVCKTCTTSNCLTCVGNYPMNNNICVANCPQFLDHSTNTCVANCQPTDLIYQSSNLNGFAFNVCFKLICGMVQANKKIQTVQHQTNQYLCSQPCDDGYYADYGVLKCQECQIPCLKCDGVQDFCITCIEDTYFYENSCFFQCPDLFEDNISKQCVGGCDNGYQLDFNNLKACVQQCDNNKYGIIAYYYKFYCLEIPYYNLYCVGQYCNDCDSQCYTCFGPYNNQCLSCNNLFLYNNICYDACIFGLYSIATTWDCQLTCPAGTFSMDGQQQCFNPCPNGTYLYSNQCYLQQQVLTYCNVMEQRFLCFDCYQTCQSCTDKFSTSCTTCKIGYYFSEGTCKITCPKGTYLFDIECFSICPNDLKMQVDLCVDSCDLGYTEYDNYCKLTCPDGTYKFDQICQPCYVGCATCTDQGNNQCQSCNTGYYFQSGNTCDTSCPSDAPCKNQMNNQCGNACPNIGYVNVLIDAVYCVLTCPSYYYGRLCLNPCPSQTWLNGNECRLCNKSCIVCQGDLISECSQCQADHYLDQSTCVQNCPVERPYANMDDNKCVEICQSYTYFNLMLCFQSCPSYLFTYDLNPNLIECVEQCYPGSYISGQSCQFCAPECIQCYDSDSHSCIHCQIGFYLSGTICQSYCPAYYDEVNQSCVPDCEPTQFQHNTQCLLNCPVGYLVNEMKCIQQCPPVTYLQGFYCLPCDYRCSECMDGSNLQCAQCITDYFMNGSICTLQCPNLYDYINFQCVNLCPDASYLIDNNCYASCPLNYLVIQDQMKCVQQCSSGYYQDQVQCKNCDYTCSECSAINKCSACAENFALNIDQCVQICWQNNLLFYDKVNRLCQSICPNYHYSAFGKYLCVDQCDYYFGQFCVDACPLGQYGDDQNICQTCPQNCVECTSATDCTSCKDPLVLTNGQCLIGCLNQYLNVQTKTCVNQCSINQYLLDDRCINSCPSQYFEYNFKCLQQCPISTYRNEQHCLDCSLECLSCVGPNSSNCLLCAQGFYKNNQICTQTCPINYYYDMYNFVCSLKCDKNLFELNDQCLDVCPILSYYEKCVSFCPIHTYQFNLVCQDCKPICLTCNQSECQSCVDGYYLNNGLCGLLCPNYYDQFKKQCVDNCETQQFIFMDQCLINCPNLPTYSYNQQCLINCPDYTIIDGSKCSDCPERCQTCLIPTNCEKCQQGYYLNNGICLVACPESNPYQYNGLCVLQCPGNTFYLLKKCVDKCPNKFQAQKCLDKCPDGYFGDICYPCQSQCRTCTSYQICTSCNSNYYLDSLSCDTSCPEIYDTIRWECTDFCDGLKQGQYCYSSCPIDSFQQDKLCQNQCNDGYYNLNYICTQCAPECSLCTSSVLCQQCSISYYLHEQNCLLICPIGLFSDPKSKNCNSKCPNNMFAYQRQCLYSCPKGYFQNNKECTQSCSSDQFFVGEVCKDCPLECDGCTGLKNSDCIICSSSATLKEGLCQSSQCVDGYYLLDGQCQECSFRCQTCNESQCITCRGDRFTADCICLKGYFDDGIEDSCQQCPCLECKSMNDCTKCKNNQQIPNCSCERQLNSEWCISCDVGRTNIYFSYDLNLIIIDFGYIININLINPFQPSDCNRWLINSNMLGYQNTCYLIWNRTQVIIQLGSQASVNVGDELQFQQNFYKDVNDKECIGFIKTFIQTTVKAPQILIKPYIEFDNPDLISPCMKTTIKQISVWGTGQRDLSIQWKAIKLDLDENHYFELDYYLQSMGNSLIFDINILQPNQTYAITARYTNILSRLNTTTFKFKTNLNQKPFVYLTYKPLTAHGYIFDCYAFQDLQNAYTLFVLIQYQNKTILTQNLLIANQFSIEVNESLLPRGQILEVTASIDDIIIKKNVILEQYPYQLKFQQQSRFLGLQGHITARANDPNIDDATISQMKFNYQWVCTNLHNLQPCKSQENQIIQFPNSRVLQILMDSPNMTFAFYCNASKDQGWIVQVQKIVITNLNIENDFIENDGDSISKINPNDDIFIVLKAPQQYAMIMQNYLLIGTIQIIGYGLSFKLANYPVSQGNITIYLLPSNESLKYQLNYEKIEGSLQISPETGYSLDQFQITMNISSIDLMDLPLRYGFFQYLKYSSMLEDTSNYQNVNGLPLSSFQSNNTIYAYLSNSLDNIYVLCQIIDNKGYVLYFNTSIKVNRKYSSYQQSINAQPAQNQSLQQINAVLQMLKEESKQVCLKQCSGVGTCIEGQCQCPPGYYFDDCSGSIKDKEVQYKFLSSTLDQLFNCSIMDDQQYKLFIDSLSYMTTYKESFNLFTKEKALTYLSIVSSSLSNRINQINQIKINLEYNQLNNLQHDQLDISQIVQMNDLQITMICHNLIWYYLLNNNVDKYLIQYQTRQIISQIIQLTFYILKPDDYANFSCVGGKFLLNRTNQSMITTHGRVLATNTYYDTIEAKFISNLYSDDGYFAYPNQTQPLFDYSIRLSGRSQNIQLQTNIIYTFTVQSENRYICIMRNQTNHEWEYDNCHTSYINQTIRCNCSKLGPTTIVDDYNYLINGLGEQRIILSNIIPFILFCQTIVWGCLLVASIYLDRHIHKEQSMSHGIILHINRKARRFVSFNLSEIKNTTDEKGMEPNSTDKSTNPYYEHHQDTQKNVQDIHSSMDIHDHLTNIDHPHDDHSVSLKSLQDDQDIQNHAEEDQKVNIVEKYSLQNFQILHSILNIIYKYKKNQPRWFRSLLILMRWTFCITLAGLFSYLLVFYETSVYPTIGGFLASRIIETLITEQFKQTSYINAVILKLISLFLMFIIFSLSLIGFQMMYVLITDQTDWIISYVIAFIIDLVFLDLISLIANRYLGEEAKDRLKKKVKRIKKQYEAWKIMKSRIT